MPGQQAVRAPPQEAGGQEELRADRGDVPAADSILRPMMTCMATKPKTPASHLTGAGVTERTLFRYFPNKLALVLDELIALLPEMAEAIRERPAAEPPYQAVCEGIIDFGLRHRDMMALAMATEGELEIPLDGRQRPLIDFEDTLAEVLRERYAVPAEDQISPATPAGGAPGDPLRACFAALQRGNGEPGGMRLR
jgi:AcrR family transcriptional regulator